MSTLEVIADPVAITRKLSLIERLAEVGNYRPDFYECIDLARVSETSCNLIADMATSAFDFNSILGGGRGESYRLAQINPMIRSTGIRQLFKLIRPAGGAKEFTPQHRVLDVLGGDGVLARAINQMLPPARRPHIITSDLAEDMMRSCAGLWIICRPEQPGQRLLLEGRKQRRSHYRLRHTPHPARSKTRGLPWKASSFEAEAGTSRFMISR